MFRINEKLNKIVVENLEKVAVTTEESEITVEADGDAVKVEIEPTGCIDCNTDEDDIDYDFFSDLDPEEDIDDEAKPEEPTEEPVEEGLFGKKKKPEQKATPQKKAKKWQVYDCWNKLVVGEYDTRPEAEDSAASRGHDGRYRVQMSESVSIIESAQGTYSMRMYDYIDECWDCLDTEGLKELCYAYTKWLSDDEVHEFAKANDIVPVFEDDEELYEGIFSNAAKDTEVIKKALQLEGQDLTNFARQIASLVRNVIDDMVPPGNKENCAEFVDVFATAAKAAARPDIALNSFVNSCEIYKIRFDGRNTYDDFEELARITKILYNPGDNGVSDVKAFGKAKKSFYKILGPMLKDAFESAVREKTQDWKLYESKSIRESANAETNTTYLARAMHNMYINGSDYEEIADDLGCSVELVLELIGPESYED